MKMQLFTARWWSAASVRALRTAVLVALPYLPAALTDTVPYLTIASAAVMGGILSYLTSLTGLSEVDGRVMPWYFAILERVVKTAAQALVTALATTVFVTDVNVPQVLSIVASSAFGSLLLAVLKILPESEDPADASAVSSGKHVAVTATPDSTVIVNTAPQPSFGDIHVSNPIQSPSTPFGDLEIKGVEPEVRTAE
jgi:hypothetical protein